MDKLFFVIPVYNVEKYLKRCVDSVIEQTYDNIQIVLINDGSTDTSGSICDEYAKKYNNVTVIHKENGGLSDARNAGLKYVFENATSQNIITEDEKAELLQIAKKTYYPKRNYAQTLSSSTLDDDKKDKLIDFIRQSTDIKKEDAKDLIKCIKHEVE